MEKRRSWPVRLVLWVYGLVNGLRRFVLNVIFFIILVAFISALFSHKGPLIEDGSALLLAPRGEIVEQASTQQPFDALMAHWFGSDKPPQTPLNDILTAIKEAKDDPRIKIMIIDTSELYYGGLSQLAEIKDAITDFKTSGKKVIARGDYFSQTQYYLASQANEVYLDPMGVIEIDGFAKVRTYFKGALDKLGVNVHVFKVGTHKSAVEPYTRNDMSPEDKEGSLKWLGAMWDGYKADVALARGLSVEDMQAYADHFAERLIETKGDMAQLAVNAKLIDGLKTRIEFDTYIHEIVGDNESGDDYKYVDAIAYADTFKSPTLPGQSSVGVIVAEGEIVDGSGGEQVVAGDTLAAQIRDAREDDGIKALVLRVNSPGGSAFASEVIRRELEATQKAGKPVVVSMSTVAASGGYWISASADEIYAHPYTITGSIGIFAMLPTVENLINEYGIYRDGIGTTKLSGAFDIGRPLTPEVSSILQQSINNGYERFLTLVSTSRKKTREEVDSMAQGQVWNGAYAQTIGLVDKLGSLHDAVKSAAEKAKLGEHYDVRYVERELTPAEQFAQMLSSQIQTFSPEKTTIENPMMWEAKAAVREAVKLARMNDPQHMYAHCMCVLN